MYVCAILFFDRKFLIFILYFCFIFYSRFNTTAFFISQSTFFHGQLLISLLCSSTYTQSIFQSSKICQRLVLFDAGCLNVSEQTLQKSFANQNSTKPIQRSIWTFIWTSISVEKAINRPSSTWERMAESGPRHRFG